MKQKIPVQVIFREYFEGILAAFFLALFLRFFVVSVLYIPSDNMEMGLRKGDFIIGWKLSYGLPLPLQGGRLNPKPPQRGDVVALRFPGDEEQILVRRIVGLPGDSLRIQEGRIEINGESAVYEEEYESLFESWPKEQLRYELKKPLLGDMEALQIPEGHFFVLADHRKRTDDSRSWGLVPFKNIESRMKFIWLSVGPEGGDLKVRWDRLFKRIL